jgi:DNA-binding XRE family transcriptional regulator
MGSIANMIRLAIESAKNRRVDVHGDECIGELFRTARVTAGISLRDAAGRIGISEITLGEYERGVKQPKTWRPLFQKLSPTLAPNRYITTTNVSHNMSYVEQLFMVLLNKLGGKVSISPNDIRNMERGDYSLQRVDDPIHGLTYTLSKNS